MLRRPKLITNNVACIQWKIKEEKLWELQQASDILAFFFQMITQNRKFFIQTASEEPRLGHHPFC